MARQTLFNRMAHLPSLSDHFGFKLFHCFASPVRDLVVIVKDRFFFFIPVYLYSSAYKLIINTPTCYAGCSRGCPAAFKHQTRLSLSSWTRNPTASKNQAESVDVDWMCSPQ